VIALLIACKGAPGESGDTITDPDPIDTEETGGDTDTADTTCHGDASWHPYTDEVYLQADGTAEVEVNADAVVCAITPGAPWLACLIGPECPTTLYPPVTITGSAVICVTGPPAGSGQGPADCVFSTSAGEWALTVVPS
jgi:hypothetical protein